MWYKYDEDAALRYDAAVTTRDGEVEFYLELARLAADRGLPTLELACGTGRIAIPLAREGVPLVGLDSSEAMLDRARAKGEGLDGVEWRSGDMCSFELGREFGLVIIPAGSLQLLLSPADHVACLRCIHRHLATDGRLAFELDNPNAAAMGEWLTTKRGTLQRRPHRDYENPRTGNHVYSWGTVEYHTSEQTSIGQEVTEEVDEQGVVIRRTFHPPMRTHYFYRLEVEHLLARCGFEVEALYSDVGKREFRGNSPGMLWVARRSADLA